MKKIFLYLLLSFSLHSEAQMLLNPFKTSNGGGVVYDSDAQAFFTAAGISDNTQKSAVNQLVLDLKADGIWSKLRAIYPYVGGSSSTHAVNLKNPGTYDITWVNSPTHSSNGVDFNGSNQYGNTGIAPSNTADPGEISLHVYVRDNTAIVGGDIGAASAGFGQTLIYSKYIDNNYYTSANSAAYGTAASADARGFWSVGREGISGGNEFTTYKNGVSLGVAGAGPTTPLTSNIFVGALNDAGTPYDFCDRQQAFAAIGDGLTDAEMADLYTAVQAFQTTLGRNV